MQGYLWPSKLKKVLLKWLTCPSTHRAACADVHSGGVYIPARAQSWRPPGDRSLPRRKPVSLPHQSPAWLKARVCPTTCQKMRQISCRWKCWPQQYSVAPLKPDWEAEKQNLVSDADFLKSTQLISSLALITWKNHFSPPLQVQVGGNSCSIPLFVGGGNKEWQQFLLNWPRVWRLREIITPTTRLPVIIRLWLAGPPGPDKKSSCLTGWKKNCSHSAGSLRKPHSSWGAAPFSCQNT